MDESSLDTPERAGGESAAEAVPIGVVTTRAGAAATAASPEGDHSGAGPEGVPTMTPTPQPSTPSRSSGESDEAALLAEGSAGTGTPRGDNGALTASGEHNESETLPAAVGERAEGGELARSGVAEPGDSTPDGFSSTEFCPVEKSDSSPSHEGSADVGTPRGDRGEFAASRERTEGAAWPAAPAERAEGGTLTPRERERPGQSQPQRGTSSSPLSISTAPRNHPRHTLSRLPLHLGARVRGARDRQL